MRLVTITNWAYGATVFLTLAAGTTMLMASGAQEAERAAVEQRYELDQASSRIENDAALLSEQAGEYVVTGAPAHLIAYRREAAALGTLEDRIRHLRDAGASEEELASLVNALRWMDTLHDEQQQAIAAFQSGDDKRAREIMFGAEYRLDFNRADNLIDQFQYRLDHRTATEVAAAGNVARIWKACSEIALALTGLLFLAVLYFVFIRRVLHPVVRLSDVVARLAAQDYGVANPDFDRIDEIGDMAQAIQIFRENGLERQRLEAERSADEAIRALLSRMTQRMQSCDTMRDLERVIQRFGALIMPDLAGRLYLLDQKRDIMVEKCAWLSPVHSRHEFSTMACWALQRGDLHQPSGEAYDVPCDHVEADAAGCIDYVCLPLTAQRMTLGLLYLEPREGAASPRGERSRAYLKLLAENIGLALGNLHLRDQLREMALADPLTGLANRRHLEIALDAEIAEANRLGRPLSCLMLDVDHFKQFNDEFGHDAGDAVLRTIGEILSNATREHELAFRYGGEEFLLLMPELDAEQAIERALEIRAAIDTHRIRHDGRTLGPLTASIGVASAPLHCAFHDLVRTADAALLRAKETGRDRVEVAESRRAERRAV